MIASDLISLDPEIGGEGRFAGSPNRPLQRLHPAPRSWHQDRRVNLRQLRPLPQRGRSNVLLASTTTSLNSKKSAIGVIFRDQIGQFHHAIVKDNGEVLLAAGALGSPQLLLLSRIGPRLYLSSLGIPVAHHSPYVGQFLFDNSRNGISIERGGEGETERGIDRSRV
ncbi:hypothetical protein DM860_007132 [Cuscuta australis]|uniref:Glucose-methanol-choline oxidoreductase N-terminal domain-containing protein n=1 Tax=Cuscuta australis TaxID=267555 RepID=A0A328E7B9_9ASTE|nr:hypothetical protein DM860_007132 [Cuscuta australis]